MSFVYETSRINNMSLKYRSLYMVHGWEIKNNIQYD